MRGTDEVCDSSSSCGVFVVIVPMPRDRGCDIDFLGQRPKEQHVPHNMISLTRSNSPGAGRHWIWGVERGGKIVSPPKRLARVKMFSCFEKPQTFFEKPFYEEIDFGGNWRSNIGTIPGFLEIEKYKKHFF